MLAKASILFLLLVNIYLTAQTPEEDFARIRGLYSTQQYRLAVRDLTRFLERYPTSQDKDDAEYLLGVCRFEIQDYSGALSVLRRFERSYPDSPYLKRIYFWRGQALKATGQNSEAQREFENQIQMEPQGPFFGPSLFFLGQVLESQEKLSEAEQTYARAARALSLRPHGAASILNRARLLRRLGRNPEARDVLNQVLNQGDLPNSRELILEYSRVLVSLDDSEGSKRQLERLLTGSLRDEIYYNAVREYFALCVKLGEKEKALELYARAEPLWQTREDILSLRADLLRETGDIKTARDIWRTLVQKTGTPVAQAAAWNLAVSLKSENPQESGVFFLICENGPDEVVSRNARWARSYSLEGEELFNLLDQVVSDEKDKNRHYSALLRLLEWGQKKGDAVVLIRVLDMLLKDYAESPAYDTFLYTRARLRGAEESDLALAELQTLLKDFPGSIHRAEVLYFIGNIYARNAEFLRAEGFFHNASQVAQGELKERSLLSRGISLINGDRRELGITVFQRLLSEYPETTHRVQASLTLAQSLTQTKRYSEAETLLLETASRVPIMEAEVWTEMGFVKIKQGDFSSASSWFQRTLGKQGSDSRLIVRALEGLATSQIASSQWREAETTLNHPAWSSTQKEPVRLAFLALVYAETSRYNQAFSVTDTLYQNYRTSLSARSVLLDLATRESIPPAQGLRALNLLKQRFPESEENYQGMLRIAVIYLQLKQSSLLEQSIQEWLEKFGKDSLRFSGARVLAKLFNEISDREILERIVNSGSNLSASISAEFYLIRARQLMEADEDRAKTLLQRIMQNLTTASQKEEANEILAGASLRKREYEEADTIYRRLTLSQDSEMRSSGFLGLGLVLKARGISLEAAQNFLLSGKQGPWENSARGLWEAVQMYKGLGNSVEVARISAQLRTDFPDSPWTRRLE